MLTEDTHKILDHAQRILKALPGWELSADTMRMIREHDSFYWVGLSHPGYPGSEIGISQDRTKDRLSLSVRYPKDWEPYIDGRGRVYSESITVSASKSAEQIAKDIKKRLIEDTGYLAQLADCLSRKHEREVGYDAGEVLARELAAIAGTSTARDKTEHYARQNGSNGLNHLRTDENRLKFGDYDTAQGTVSHGGQSVSLEFPNLSPDLARELLTIWKEHKR